MSSGTVVVAVPWMLEMATILRLFDPFLMRFGSRECHILVPEVVAVLVTPCLLIFVNFCLFLVFRLGVICWGLR